MADKTLLVAAYDSPGDDVPIAAALNFIGEDTLYGRNWGCRSDINYPGLHMELCTLLELRRFVRPLQPRCPATHCLALALGPPPFISRLLSGAGICH